jgi:hypothetical protein
MHLVFFLVEIYFLNYLKINSTDEIIIFVIEAFRRFSEFTQDVKLLWDKFNPDKVTLFMNLLTYNKTRYFYVPKYSFNDVKLKIAVCSWSEIKQ